MRIDHVFLLFSPMPDGPDDIVSAFIDKEDAEATLRCYPGGRVERIPLAPRTGAGISRNSLEGEAEVADCLDELHRSLVRHNVGGCVLGVNAFHAAARLNFPTWSTIQADDEKISVQLLDGEHQPRTEASIDLVSRLAKVMAAQTGALVRLAQDLHARYRPKKLVVVPGLPAGLRR